MDSDCPPEQRLQLLLLEASKEQRVKWNRTSTAEIDFCGFIYTSGLQTPRLASLHIRPRAVRRGAEVAALQYCTMRKGPDPGWGSRPPSHCSQLLFWVVPELKRANVYLKLSYRQDCSTAGYPKEREGNTAPPTLTWRSPRFKVARVGSKCWLYHIPDRTGTKQGHD